MEETDVGIAPLLLCERVDADLTAAMRAKIARIAQNPECVECGGPVSRQLVDVDVKVGERVKIVVTRLLQKCARCPEYYLSGDEMDELHRAAADIVREREGLLSPGEIKLLRESMHLSQAQFERLLRTGPKTVVRWERGRSSRTARPTRCCGPFATCRRRAPTCSSSRYSRRGRALDARGPERGTRCMHAGR